MGTTPKHQPTDHLPIPLDNIQNYRHCFESNILEINILTQTLQSNILPESWRHMQDRFQGTINSQQMQGTNMYDPPLRTIRAKIQGVSYLGNFFFMERTTPHTPQHLESYPHTHTYIYNSWAHTKDMLNLQTIANINTNFVPQLHRLHTMDRRNSYNQKEMPKQKHTN